MSDLISRQDAIEAVKSLPQTPNGYSDTYDKAVFIGILEELPSAEAHEIRTETHGACLISKEYAIARIANDNVVGGMDRINEYRESTEHNDYLDGISDAIATVDEISPADAVSREDYLQMTINYTKMKEAYLDLNKYVYMLEHLSIEDRVRIMYDAVEDVHNIRIINEPSAEAVQGEWKHKPSKSGEWVWWQCSECGAVIYSESEVDRKIHHAYCGVCGARMKGGTE